MKEKKLKRYQVGGIPGSAVTNTGYLSDSPDRFNPYNIIPSGKITMQHVQFPVHGTDNLGYQQMMYPGGNYSFPGSHVMEVPMKRYGGGLPKAQNGMAGFGPWLGNGISADDQQNQDDYNTQQIKNSGNFNQGLPQIPGYSPQMIPSNALAAQGSSINSNYRAFPAVDIFQPPPGKTGLAKAWDFTKKYGADIMQTGLGAVGNTLTDLAAKRNERAYATHLGGSDNLYTPYTSQGNQGDYDPNTGAFRPNQKVATQFSATPYNSYGVPTAAYGGNVFQNGLPKASLGLSNDLSIQPMSSSDLSSGNMSGVTLPSVANINEGLMPGTPMTPMPKFQMPTAEYNTAPIGQQSNNQSSKFVPNNSFADYAQKAESYIQKINPNANITGEMLARGAQLSQEKYNRFVPVELALAQLKTEGFLAKGVTPNKPQRTNNPFNVGNVDNGNTVTDKTVQGGVNRYYDLMAKNYLNTKTPDQLLQSFTNGKNKRYASDVHYEDSLKAAIAGMNHYQQGGEYDMDDATIKHLTSQGYTIDHI